jgi:hypothetical protein
VARTQGLRGAKKSRRVGGRDPSLAHSVPTRSGVSVRGTANAPPLAHHGRAVNGWMLPIREPRVRRRGTSLPERCRRAASLRAAASGFAARRGRTTAFRHHAAIRILMDGESGISVVGPFNALWASAPLVASTSIARQPRYAAVRGRTGPARGAVGRTRSIGTNGRCGRSRCIRMSVP